jgi:predicted ATPase
MIRKLRFTNFKSWAAADMRCAPITGVFGTNSSGKTSLIQFLLLMKQTKDATDRAIALALNGDYVKLGTYGDAVHRHDESKTVEYGLTVELPKTLELRDPSQKNRSVVTSADEMSISAAVSQRNKALIASLLEYSLGDYQFRLSQPSGEQSQFELSALSGAAKQSEFKFIRTQGRVWKLPGPIKSYAFPDQARTYFQNAGFLADLESAYETALDRIFYLGPLRDYPQRDYLWARTRPTDVGQRGEKTVDAILAATEAKEIRNLKSKSKNKPFQEIIAYWLKEIGLVEDFKIEEIAKGSNRWQAKVKTRLGSSEVLLTDVGFGVSQVLPVITLLQYVPEGSTVILEQPEIHLHPLAQAALADVIIQAATHRKLQVILESHSEHLLLRLQRRIAEQTLKASDVKLYFCDAPNGTSVLTELEMDMFGVIKNWPVNFMGDAFTETAEAELARLKRMVG